MTFNQPYSEKLIRYIPAALKKTSDINLFRRTTASLNAEGFNLQCVDSISYVNSIKVDPFMNHILACSFFGDLGPEVLPNFPNQRIETGVTDSNGELELLVNPLSKYFSILPGLIWIERLMDKNWRLILNAAQSD